MSQPRRTTRDLGTRVRVLRQQRGWTARRLAEACEVTEGAILQTERGVTQPAEKLRLTLERWIADENALDDPPEFSLLPRRVAAIEARLTKLEEKCDQHQRQAESMQLSIDELQMRTDSGSSDSNPAVG